MPRIASFSSQSFTGIRGVAIPTFVIDIISDQREIDVATFATNYGWNGTSHLELRIAQGVIIDSNNTSDPALVVDGNFPNDLTIINEGTIVGMGGAGGGSNNNGTGEQGGTALSIVMGQLYFNNLGTIAGGGGGGGAGGAGFYFNEIESTDIANGGGGGQSSRENSAGGLRGQNQSFDQGSTGSPGTLNSFGQGAVAWVFDNGSSRIRAGRGGNGGSWGSPGELGEETTATNSFSNFEGNPFTGFVPGAAGIAVNGFNNATWVNEGTIVGPTTN